MSEQACPSCGESVFLSSAGIGTFVSCPACGGPIQLADTGEGGLTALRKRQDEGADGSMADVLHQRNRRADSVLSGVDWFLIILFGSIGLVVGIVYLAQGKQKAWKMFGAVLSVMFAKLVLISAIAGLTGG